MTVPIIVIFTKYDDFKRKMKIKMKKELGRDGATQEVIEKEVQDVFEREYLSCIHGETQYVQLESEFAVESLYMGH